MLPLRLAVLAFCLLSPAAVRAADAKVHLYLQPLPSEAARLTFVVSSVSAVTDAGSEHPLDLHLQVVGPAEARRQRLLASGRLPTGSYAGFAIRIERAAVKGEQGEVALLVPDEPFSVEAGFDVTGQHAPLFWLSFKYESSISSGFAFNPAFSAIVAPRPLVSLAGFVSNSNSNTITVFDKKRLQAAEVVPTCDGPSGMALDQQTGRLFVACSRDDEIQVIDVAAAELVERSRLLPGDGPREVALTPDGRTLVSVNTGSDSISFFDAVSLGRQERLAVGSGPSSILIEPAGRRAFVFNTLSSSVSVIDVASRTLVATVPTDSAPLRGQFSARGDRLFVIHERSPYVTVVDSVQLTVLTRARLRLGIGSIKVDGRRGLLYIGGRNDTSVEVYDPVALVPVDTIRTGQGISYLTLDDEENRLYMVSPETSRLVVASLADRKVVSEIDVGEGPCWVAVMGER